MGNIDIHILTTQSPLGKNPEAEEFLLSDSSKTPHTTQQLNYTNTGKPSNVPESPREWKNHIIKS